MLMTHPRRGLVTLALLTSGAGRLASVAPAFGAVGLRLRDPEQDVDRIAVVNHELNCAHGAGTG